MKKINKIKTLDFDPPPTYWSTGIFFFCLTDIFRHSFFFHSMQTVSAKKKSVWMCRKATATAGCCGAARATRVSWCGWFLVLWVDPSDQSKFNSNETSDERVVVAACLSLSLPWSPKRNKIPIFFHFFFQIHRQELFRAISLCLCCGCLSLSN